MYVWQFCTQPKQQDPQKMHLQGLLHTIIPDGIEAPTMGNKPVQQYGDGGLSQQCLPYIIPS